MDFQSFYYTRASFSLNVREYEERGGFLLFLTPRRIFAAANEERIREFRLPLHPPPLTFGMQQNPSIWERVINRPRLHEKPVRAWNLPAIVKPFLRMAPTRAVDGKWSRRGRESKNFIFIIIKVG